MSTSEIILHQIDYQLYRIVLSFCVFGLYFITRKKHKTFSYILIPFVLYFILFWIVFVSMINKLIEYGGRIPD
jgi:hypothetical protein